MIKLPHYDLDTITTDKLSEWQIDYMKEITAEGRKALWKNKRQCKDFAPIKQKLENMLNGRDCCMYCEDNEAYQVEHFWPRVIYPELAFEWMNYLYVCGKCNLSKSTQFATISERDTLHLQRSLTDPTRCHRPALLNPRYDDPMDYFTLDIQGNTFEFTPRIDLKGAALERANYTKSSVPFNRDTLRRRRRQAYRDYRNDIQLYINYVQSGNRGKVLEQLEGIRYRSHRTVLREMQRQWPKIDELRQLFEPRPELHHPGFPSNVTTHTRDRFDRITGI
jgi:uncharacterized protein (TIGR02646 family)